MVLSARLKTGPPAAHALTSRANTSIARLMYGDEVFSLAFGRLREEVKQPITIRESLRRVSMRFNLTNVHRGEL